MVEKTSSSFYTAAEVASILEVSLSSAYRHIKHLNNELRLQGFIVVPGKISRRYFHEKFHC